MKQLFTILTAAFLSIVTAGFAQETRGKILGSVIDGNTKTIESASINLMRAKDSSLAKISASDKSGNFTFEGIPFGKYFVSISAVAHERVTSEVVELNATHTVVTLKR